ncbi:prepilin peptidase-dependent protein [Tatumella sp. JGM118]|uniref:prepilin peptidase-dependent protein n=1 Tax=Tatumella sp. JGM118 TaxID=2799796 RepID=UPI001BB0A897|nr:prepilin peptidase-dependent protein [Tatumella sp. JGM118]MBS0909992.1 prepilin peptidase-dependent protein [Tatumella sp. JGM118]
MPKPGKRSGKRHGFTLGEMLLALLISSGIFLGAARFFPHLVRNNGRLQQQTLLAQEVHELLLMLEKHFRRAGYCEKPPCARPPVILSADGRCLIVRLQSRRYVPGEVSGSLKNDSYGFRWRDKRLETQRGVTGCDGSGWEGVNDPASLQIMRLRFLRERSRLGVELTASAGSGVTLTRRHWVLSENL